MDRRNFIQISFSALGLAVTPLVIVSCNSKSQWTEQLSTPAMLGKFCSEKEIGEIGRLYCIQTPEEKNTRNIEEKLLTQADGNILEPASKEILDQHLTQLIDADFQQDQTVMISGWVISRTEARQCALYFLTHS